nr:MAG TPA: hypothetical protein [Caudoviricetes sp.]DAV60481.1 MAG TPA: hypothetical protein [Caudoviricetes sp.]
MLTSYTAIRLFHIEPYTKATPLIYRQFRMTTVF